METTSSRLVATTSRLGKIHTGVSSWFYVAVALAAFCFTAARGCGTFLDDAGEIGTEPKGQVVKSPWPWMVALFEGPKYICGGTLLDRDTVITAAQCFRGTEPIANNYTVRLGVRHPNEPPSDRSTTLPVKSIRLHEDYQVGRPYKDIAVVRLGGKATYGAHIGPACLPQSDVKLGEQAVFLGWGLTESGGRYSEKLKEGHLRVISNKECGESLGQTSSYKSAVPEGVTNDFVCAVNQTGNHPCQGDSGGPLLALGDDLRWSVVGLVNFGVGCDGRFPEVFTRVSTFLSWIEENRG